MGLLASDNGLRRTTLPSPSPEQCVAELGREVDQAVLSPERFERLHERLNRYFQGESLGFEDEPIDVGDASPFLKAAWNACRAIPRGERRSYQWLAAQTGRPRAPRAAGQSMARNRLPIIIPCHRVIGSDGSLRGFGKGKSGLELKRRLLDLEADQA